MKHKQAAFDHCINKFCPYFIIGAILFHEFTFADFRPYLAIGLIYFIEKFSFNVGFACGRYDHDTDFRNKVEGDIDS